MALPGHDLAGFYEVAVISTESSEPTMPAQSEAHSASNPEARKALEVIGGLRGLAYEVTQFRDFREYLWGLLLDALFVATLVSRDSPQRERALLLGGVLCERLQSWT
jgi:hypothetical protein